MKTFRKISRINVFADPICNMSNSKPEEFKKKSEHENTNESGQESCNRGNMVEKRENKVGKTDLQFFFSTGLTFLFGGITLFLFGLDKGGFFTIDYVPYYLLVGFIAIVFGLIIIISVYMALRKRSKFSSVSALSLNREIGIKEQVQSDEKKNRLRIYLLGAAAMITTWAVAIWNKVIEKIGIGTDTLIFELIIVTLSFFFILYLYNKA